MLPCCDCFLERKRFKGERCLTERGSSYPLQTPSTFLACLKEIPVASRILTSTRRATTRILSSARLPQPALFRATHPSLTLLQSSLPSLHQPALFRATQPALFRATTLERLQQRALCRPLPPLFRLPHSRYRPCLLLLFILLNESLTPLFLLNFTPTPLPSLVLLLPLHYHHHCVVSVRAAATLELLMV